MVAERPVVTKRAIGHQGYTDEHGHERQTCGQTGEYDTHRTNALSELPWRAADEWRGQADEPRDSIAQAGFSHGVKGHVAAVAMGNDEVNRIWIRLHGVPQVGGKPVTGDQSCLVTIGTRPEEGNRDDTGAEAVLKVPTQE